MVLISARVDYRLVLHLAVELTSFYGHLIVERTTVETSANIVLPPPSPALFDKVPASILQSFILVSKPLSFIPNTRFLQLTIALI